MIRLGLCCKFYQEPIKFNEIRYIHFKKLSPKERLEKLSDVISKNLEALFLALNFCDENQILAFRVGSEFLPLYTHVDCKYSLEELPGGDQILTMFEQAKTFAKKRNIRLSFHPDQYVVLNSPREEVVINSVEDLKYHRYMCKLLGADVINIHAGGVYGDKSIALKRLKKNILELPKDVKECLTLENDDKSYTSKDLLPFCEEVGIPFVYDVHHHRCLPDGLGEPEVTKRAYRTWDREPLFHVSSPKEGWEGPKPSRHHDYIDIKDFPSYWKELGDLTVDIEAKAKELAILKLKEDFKTA